MVIEKAPPDNNGVTQINPPAPERRKFFEVQRDKGDFAALIPELEKTLARSPFWLDGHCEVVKALRALGPEYETAAQTVVRELNYFLQRLPEVSNLSFADETAFASDQTRLWLDAEVLRQDDATSVSSDGDGVAGEPWNLALLEAKQVAAGGDSDEAIALLNAGLANAGAVRAQIYWRCALAELLLQIGKAGPATAILESLSQQAESRQMDEWEPQLMSRIYNLLIQGYQKQQKSKKDDKSLKEKAEQAFAQLCWFDPITAISLKGG
jgi:type VI secretion system protein VasJ